MKYLQIAHMLAQGLPPHLIGRMRGITADAVRDARERYEQVTGHVLPRFKAGRPRKFARSSGPK